MNCEDTTPFDAVQKDFRLVLTRLVFRLLYIRRMLDLPVSCKDSVLNLDLRRPGDRLLVTMWWPPWDIGQECAGRNNRLLLEWYFFFWHCELLLKQLLLSWHFYFYSLKGNLTQKHFDWVQTITVSVIYVHYNNYGGVAFEAWRENGRSVLLTWRLSC